MKRRRWDSKTKTRTVLEGLSGRLVSEICNKYGIHQNQYYTWRDKFLSEAHVQAGLIITTVVTFILHMDTAHRFMQKRSISEIPLHI